MEEINADWLKQHLNGRRGAQAQLSRETGISKDKINKILRGSRQVQPGEADLIYKFFYPSSEGGIPDEQRELLELFYQLDQAERDFLIKSAKGLLSPLDLSQQQPGEED